MSDHERFERQLVGFLAILGAAALKGLSQKQRAKLKEWVLPYSFEKLELSGEPVKLQMLRKYIDQWEHTDLSPENYRFYYVDKTSDGSSFRDRLPF